MTVGALVDYLKTQSEKGVNHVYLSQAARDAIRTAIQVNKNNPSASAPPSPPSALEAKRPTLAVKPTPRPEPRPREPRVRVDAPAPPSRSSVVAPGSVAIQVPDGNQTEQLAALAKQAESWAPAHSLGTLRQRLVFSAGNPNADLMIIGDAPGFDDEMTRVPFAGKAGQKLDKILKAMTLKRDDLYLTNICKFRPLKSRQTTDNRKPTAQEMSAFLPLLRKEIEIVQPKCILVLGASATEALLGASPASVASLRGTWQKYMDLPVLPSFHPTYLLRNESNTSAKRMLWEDMLLVMAQVGIEISDKQRGYFIR